MGYEARLDKTIEDAKYWLETYTAAFKAHDKDMQGLRTELSGRLGTVIDACALRVSITDMTLNFKTLNDMLFVKFQQVEEVKSGLRDVIAFQMDFYPMQMQAAICENLKHCAAAQADQGYVKYT